VFGRRVDLRTPKELSSYFRDQVLADAQDEYVA
jgi:predicted nucleotidyltransferase